MSDQQIQSSAEEVENRIDQAFSLLLKGYNQREIVDWLDGHAGWGITKRQIRKYVGRARLLLSEMASGDIDRREQFTLAVMRLNAQYGKANRADDTARAIQATMALVSLLKLDTPSAQLDWRVEAAAAGIEVSELFTQLVQAAAEARRDE